MSTPTNPALIARETLKQLLLRKIPPSPDHYQEIYEEISGVKTQIAEAFPERELRSFLQLLPKETPSQQGLTRQLDIAIKSANWEEFKSTLSQFITEHSSESDLAWGELIGEVVRQWENRQAGLTPARKREALERVLTGSNTNPELLFNRLQNLTKAWARNEIDDASQLVDASNIVAAPSLSTEAQDNTPSYVSRASELLAELRDLFIFTIEAIIVPQLIGDDELVQKAKKIAGNVRTANTLQLMTEIQDDLKRFAYLIEFVAEDNQEIRQGVLKLLQLMLDNINELVVDDTWLSGQIDIVREIIVRPMNIRTLNDAEQRLKEVIYKQGQLKKSLLEAREALKQMLAGFVDHLASFADTTSEFHDKMELCVGKISNAKDITELQDVMSEVISSTRAIQKNARKSRDELRMARENVSAAEQRINELQAELDKTSMLVRHDQLTGALNRRGLDEIFDKESARARRRESPLAVALLDIDNFKKLNDTYGHDAGDAALIHLVSTIKDTLRPHDILARFGGEEFIILLPDTGLEDANAALVRLQRELTKRYFLANNEKLLITFSAGITNLRAEDSLATAAKRADSAMYTAKKTGKNKVVIAPDA